MERRPTRAAWAAELLTAASLDKPEGDGPFPLVIQLHGCGGRRTFQQRYADEARRQGVATLIVDSFRPRGITRWQASATICTGARLRGAERAGDLFALYDWAKRQPWVDEGRIAAAGWSHGAWAIMDGLALGDRAGRFLADAPPDPLGGLAAAVLFYPWCSFPARTTARGWGPCKPKVFGLVGGRDQTVGRRDPEKALARLRNDGLEVEQLFFPEATHAFDDDDANDPRVRYSADLTEQAIAWYGRSLAAAFA